MNFKREGCNVTFTISEDDFELLLLSIGIAAGAASRDEDNPKLFRCLIRLANTINDGNTEFEPYEIPSEAQT